MQEIIAISTSKKQEMIDITQEVDSIVKNSIDTSFVIDMDGV